MAETESFKKLEVWEKGIDLVVAAYEISKKLPETEKFGISSQMQRAAVSVPANIAEGWSRSHTKEFIQFLNIAIGSLAELQTFIEIVKKLRYINTEGVKEIEIKIEELQKMLYSLVKSLVSRL